MEKQTFYDASHSTDLQFVPFDIETTGFCDTDVITSVTLRLEDIYYVWVNTSGQDSGGTVGESISEETDRDVSVAFFENDGELLSAFRHFLTERTSTDNTVMVAYNGETWRGGFDLRFIRSRCLATDVVFPFAGYGYTDMMAIFNKHDRFNVKHKVQDPDLTELFNKSPLKSFGDSLGVEYDDSRPTKGQIEAAIESHGYSDRQLESYCEETGTEQPTTNPSGLVQVYDRIATLCGWSDADIDPFEPDESERAITAHENGDFETLIRHNIADVHKTGRLTDTVVESRSIVKSEYEPKVFPEQ